MGNLTTVRWVRAAVLSLLIVASTLAAHASGGGVLPDASMLLPLFALLTLAAAALLGRPLSWWWSATVLLAGQAVLHGALELVPRQAQAGVGGHLIGSPAHGAAETGPAVLNALTAWSGDARMLAAHVGAAALVGAWLAAGERAVWSLVALATGALGCAWLRLRHVLAAASAPSLVLPRRRPAPWVAARVALAVDRAGSGATRRGPPDSRRARSH